MIKFKIPFKLPGLNDYVNICRKNKYAGAVHKKEIQQSIMWCLPKCRAAAPVYIRFIWHEKNMRRDKDNVAFAKKYILDAMQTKGILPNDSNKYITGFSDDFVYKNGDGAEVILIESGDN